jgi:RNA polymerase sigma-B factor
MARGLETTSTVTEREQRTHELFARLEATTDPASRHEIVDAIAETNLPLADALANRYARRGCEHDDLLQVARVGLLLAVDRYRPGDGRAFVKFAVPTITGELKRYFRDCSWAVRPPRTIQELRPQVEGARAEMAQELGRDPGDAEVAARLGTRPDLVRACLNTATSYRPISLDVPVHQGSWVCLGDALATEAADLAGVVDRIDLRAALATLPPRERRVLTWRFGDDLTQVQIGERLGVSQMQVSRILRRALDRLRSLLTSDETPVAA